VFADPPLYLIALSSRTPNVPRVDILEWTKSEPPHAPPMIQPATIPMSTVHHGSITGTNTTPHIPYRGPYPPPIQFGASMRQPPYPMHMPASQPPNYPSAQSMSTLRIPSANLLLTKYTWYSDNYYPSPPASNQGSGGSVDPVRLE